MKEAISYIIPYLKQITKLGDEANNYRKLLAEQETKISVVEMKTVLVTPEKRKFVSPPIDTDLIALRKDFVRIAYDVKKEIANKSKYHSGSKSYKELGETTFYYYIKMEDLE